MDSTNMQTSGSSALFLDSLTKEEKEAMLSKKMEQIRKKNAALQKRHEEIEADKRLAGGASKSPTAAPPSRTARPYENAQATRNMQSDINAQPHSTPPPANTQHNRPNMRSPNSNTQPVRDNQINPSQVNQPYDKNYQSHNQFNRDNQPQMRGNEPPIRHNQPPVRNNQQPVRNNQQPIQNNQPPMRNSQQPMRNSQQPMRDSQQPMRDNQQPMRDSQQPMRDSQQPMRDSQQPMRDNHQPMRENQQPMMDNQQPVHDNELSLRRPYQSSPPKPNVRSRGRGKPKTKPTIKPMVGFSAHMDHLEDEEDFVHTMDNAHPRRRSQSPEFNENADFADAEPAEPTPYNPYNQHDDRFSDKNTRRNDNFDKNRRQNFDNRRPDSSGDNRNRQNSSNSEDRGDRGNSYEQNRFNRRDSNDSFTNKPSNNDNYEGEAWPDENSAQTTHKLQNVPSAQSDKNNRGNNYGKNQSNRPNSNQFNNDRNRGSSYEGEAWPEENSTQTTHKLENVPSPNQNNSYRGNNYYKNQSNRPNSNQFNNDRNRGSSYEGEAWPEENSTQTTHKLQNVPSPQSDQNNRGNNYGKNQPNSQNSNQFNNDQNCGSSYEGEAWPEENSIQTTHKLQNIPSPKSDQNNSYRGNNYGKNQSNRPNSNNQFNNDRNRRSSYEGEAWPVENSTQTMHKLENVPSPNQNNSYSGNNYGKNQSNRPNSNGLLDGDKNSYEGEPWPDENSIQTVKKTQIIPSSQSHRNNVHQGNSYGKNQPNQQNYNRFNTDSPKTHKSYEGEPWPDDSAVIHQIKTTPERTDNNREKEQNNSGDVVVQTIVTSDRTGKNSEKQQNYDGESWPDDTSTKPLQKQDNRSDYSNNQSTSEQNQSSGVNKSNNDRNNQNNTNNSHTTENTRDTDENWKKEVDNDYSDEPFPEDDTQKFTPQCQKNTFNFYTSNNFPVRTSQSAPSNAHPKIIVDPTRVRDSRDNRNTRNNQNEFPKDNHNARNNQQNESPSDRHQTTQDSEETLEDAVLRMRKERNSGGQGRGGVARGEEDENATLGAPPPDPGYNFLSDRRREGPLETWEKDARRHPKNFGGADMEEVKRRVKFEKRQDGDVSGMPMTLSMTGRQRQQYADWKKEQKEDGDVSGMPMTLSMTGRQRQQYADWKKEREEVDRRRVERQMSASGGWKREWDVDKEQVDDPTHDSPKRPDSLNMDEPPKKMSPTKVSPVKVSPAKVSPAKVSPAKVAPMRGRGRGRDFGRGRGSLIHPDFTNPNLGQRLPSSQKFEFSMKYEHVNDNFGVTQPVTSPTKSQNIAFSPNRSVPPVSSPVRPLKPQNSQPRISPKVSPVKKPPTSEIKNELKFVSPKKYVKPEESPVVKDALTSSPRKVQCNNDAIVINIDNSSKKIDSAIEFEYMAKKTKAVVNDNNTKSVLIDTKVDRDIFSKDEISAIVPKVIPKNSIIKQFISQDDILKEINATQQPLPHRGAKPDLVKGLDDVKDGDIMQDEPLMFDHPTMETKTIDVNAEVNQASFEPVMFDSSQFPATKTIAANPADTQVTPLAFDFSSIKQTKTAKDAVPSPEEPLAFDFSLLAGTKAFAVDHKKVLYGETFCSVNLNPDGEPTEQVCVDREDADDGYADDEFADDDDADDEEWEDVDEGDPDPQSEWKDDQINEKDDQINETGDNIHRPNQASEYTNADDVFKADVCGKGDDYKKADNFNQGGDHINEDIPKADDAKVDDAKADDFANESTSHTMDSGKTEVYRKHKSVTPEPLTIICSYKTPSPDSNQSLSSLTPLETPDFIKDLGNWADEMRTPSVSDTSMKDLSLSDISSKDLSVNSPVSPSNRAVKRLNLDNSLSPTDDRITSMKNYLTENICVETSNLVDKPLNNDSVTQDFENDQISLADEFKQVLCENDDISQGNCNTLIQDGDYVEMSLADEFKQVSLDNSRAIYQGRDELNETSLADELKVASLGNHDDANDPDPNTVDSDQNSCDEFNDAVSEFEQADNFINR